MATDQIAARPALDPLATEFRGVHITLFDLYRAHLQAGGGAVIEGRTFTDCVIEGPAVMLALDGVHFDSTHFGHTGGSMLNMLFRPLGTVAIGAIPVRNTNFRNCQFHTLGITGNDELLQMLAEQVKTAG